MRRTDVEFGRGPLLWTATTGNGSDLSTLDRSRSVVRARCALLSEVKPEPPEISRRSAAPFGARGGFRRLESVGG